jgi:hypothetical protein
VSRHDEVLRAVKDDGIRKLLREVAERGATLRLTGSGHIAIYDGAGNHVGTSSASGRTRGNKLKRLRAQLRRGGVLA